MRRVYFLLPDIESARRLVDRLLLKRIDERHIHLLAKRGTPMEDLPKASVAQRTDLIPALERGITVGGATGALAGLVAIAVPPAGLILGGGAVFGLAVAGAGFGAWASTMLGVSTPNSQIKRFQDAIEHGEVLAMIDVPKARVDEIEDVVRTLHPEAEIGGTEPTLPPFP